jgi:hypothetical protein
LEFFFGKSSSSNSSAKSSNKAASSSSTSVPHFPNRVYNPEDVISLDLSPTSGDEPEYEPDVWNSDEEFRKTHNCYDYAFNNKKPQKIKSQPGQLSGSYNRKTDDQTYECEWIQSRLISDHPYLIETTFKGEVPKGHYKIALRLAPDKDQDYHFFRQDRDGLWSHKPGGDPVVDRDVDGKLIDNPLTRNFIYDTYKYKNFCKFYNVPVNAHEMWNRSKDIPVDDEDIQRGGARSTGRKSGNVKKSNLQKLQQSARAKGVATRTTSKKGKKAKPLPKKGTGKGSKKGSKKGSRTSSRQSRSKGKSVLSKKDYLGYSVLHQYI